MNSKIAAAGSHSFPEPADPARTRRHRGANGGALLGEMGYSLHATSKQKEGAQHVDRDAQFHYINDFPTSDVG